MALQEVAAEYFKNLNPIATRLCDDLNEAKEDYEKLWGKLSDREKDQILNERIITPEIMLKYNKGKELEVEPIKYATKVVMDDHCSYTDEHSAPFSFRTPSQRDLTLFQKEIVKEEPKKIIIKKGSVKKNAEQFGKKLVHEEPVIDSDTSGTSLPKTGLDFLDNW